MYNLRRVYSEKWEVTEGQSEKSGSGRRAVDHPVETLLI